MIIYGLIAYLSIVLLIIGYFIAKKIGDRVEPATSPLNEEDQPQEG